MVKRYRKAVSALLAFGLAGALVGPWVGPAAASDRVCYFGECRGENAAQSKPRVVSKRGSWSAVVLGKAAMIVDDDVVWIAGRANPPSRAASSICRYFCGVATGTCSPCVR